ncbi:sigma-70 family RNA polymerase sigma factor [Nocardioides caldifontis]|uniref:sigma-70 family RNA polymerase sigma factor n=1 Tax=Nocardioides caldifontis TaxID=2588938 RepID=UPI0011DFF05C|nr:sigma-70 family RNA polymerase sigma factor [Nocardioides caldifontis]
MTAILERSSFQDSHGERERARRTHDLFLALEESSDEEERSRLRDELVTLNLSVADGIASRYSNRGVPQDDLQQVARLALVRVVRDFRLDRECDFLAYAVPSIRGALKRHFRDAGWTVRPPRRVQEAQLLMNSCRPELVQRLGREPTVPEMAAAIGVGEETVIEALAVDSCYSPDSLDRPMDVDGSGSATLGGCIGEEDPAFVLSEHRTVLGPLIRELSDRDRRVLELRFVEGLTQTEVGKAIGVSQMQVSRILSRILGDLRGHLTAPGPG